MSPPSAQASGTITIRGGKEDKNRVVPLPMATEERLKQYLAKAGDKHRLDLIAGGGDVHLPEDLLHGMPDAARQSATRLAGSRSHAAPLSDRPPHPLLFHPDRG